MQLPKTRNPLQESLQVVYIRVYFQGISVEGVCETSIDWGCRRIEKMVFQ